MRPTLERDSNGRITLSKERKRDGRVSKRALTAGLAVAFIAIAVTGIQAALAAGDNNMYNHGEDGYYEEYNCNPYDDDDFPGEDTQNRTGVDEPDWY